INTVDKSERKCQLNEQDFLTNMAIKRKSYGQMKSEIRPQRKANYSQFYKTPNTASWV
ncbi:3300_t:CDS:1, partial [Gigaspora rosea]